MPSTLIRNQILSLIKDRVVAIQFDTNHCEEDYYIYNPGPMKWQYRTCQCTSTQTLVSSLILFMDARTFESSSI